MTYGTAPRSCGLWREHEASAGDWLIGYANQSTVNQLYVAGLLLIKDTDDLEDLNCTIHYSLFALSVLHS
jgi:hypothetical protein